MSIGPNSRYTLTEVVQVIDPLTGQLARPEFQDLRQRVTEFAADDRFVTVDGSMRWDVMGSQKMGDAGAYWVIADLSGVIDPFTELNVGVRMRLPSVQRYLFQILAPNQRPIQGTT